MLAVCFLGKLLRQPIHSTKAGSRCKSELPKTCQSWSFLPRNFQTVWNSQDFESGESGCHLPGDHIRFFDQGMHVMPGQMVELQLLNKKGKATLATLLKIHVGR